MILMDCWRSSRRRERGSIPIAKTTTTAGLHGSGIQKETAWSFGSRSQRSKRVILWSAASDSFAVKFTPELETLQRRQNGISIMEAVVLLVFLGEPLRRWSSKQQTQQ